MTRKEFLQLAIAAAGTALAAACGGSAGMQAASGNCLANGSTSRIAGNHGQVLTVTKADTPPARRRPMTSAAPPTTRTR